MKVIITGGSGLVGRYAIRELLKHDIDVLNVDVQPSAELTSVPFREADLTDPGQTRAALRDVDVVVHLAAIPNPFKDPGDRVMGVNMTTTYNVIEAVRENKIKRIVYACSESASGFGIHRVEHLPLYLPIDEEHPCWPHETYSFTKYFGEVMCQEYARADRIEVVSLRYGWVWFREHRDELLKVVAKRAEPEMQRLLGAYVFAEDVAQAVRLGLTCRLPHPELPFEAFYILASEPLYVSPTLTALRNAFGEQMPPIRPPDYFRLNPRAPAFNISKARKLLGYEPRYLCQDI